MKLLYVYLIWLILFQISCEDKEMEKPDDLQEKIEFFSCITTSSADNFEVMTWNIKEFPYSGDVTIDKIKSIIEVQKPDVVAFQEISSSTDFIKLTESLADYESLIHLSGDLNLGFIYKVKEISISRKLRVILEEDRSAFPRAPVELTVKHIGDLSVTLINVHLKCCDGEDNFKRRKDASELLKEYIDLNLPDQKIIVLGDFNDEIYGVPADENPYINFINDDINYRFADMELAMKESSNWSYPGWPSHIDHILITNELFDLKRETVTLSFDNCDKNYFLDV